MVDLKETTGSDYNIAPGTTQTKDPTVTVDATVDAYVYVEVTDTTNGLVEYAIADGWIPLDGHSNVYYREVAKNDETKSFPVLVGNKVSYSTALENSDMLNADGTLKDGLNLTFKARAIQKTGFDSAVAAYEGVHEVDSVESLKIAAQNAKAGDEINLTKDITLDNTVLFDASGIIFNGNGHTITADMSDNDVENLKTVLSFGHGNTYCTGVTVKNINFTGKGGRAMHFHGGTSSVLENVTISGDWSLAINFYGTHGAVMNNCNISSTYGDKYAKSSIFANEQSANQIILNNTTVDDLFVNATEKGATYANDGIKVVVNSGSGIGTLHTNEGITRTFHKVNGGTVGSVLADIK